MEDLIIFLALIAMFPCLVVAAGEEVGTDSCASGGAGFQHPGTNM